MRTAITEYLLDQPILKILKVFCLTQKPIHLRKLVTSCDLSPGGVSFILKRLMQLGVLRSYKSSNRVMYQLTLTETEQALLEKLFLSLDHEKLERRAQTFGKRAASRFAWMDESYSFFKQVKARSHDTP